MSIAHAAAIQSVQLISSDGAFVPLQGVSARGRLEGLLFELTVEQRYRNDSEQNIEAVFTFPLPVHAVLLGLELELGERKLKAVAVEKKEASRRYEQAMDEGDTAVLLDHNGDGLYTVNLGNLMAGESAVIRYRYGQLLDAHLGYVRLAVPTVIAPRYGNPADAGLQGAAVPVSNLFAEYPFVIDLDLVGLTDSAALRSPSHKIHTVRMESGLKVSLAGSGFLDRDFVVEIPQANVPTAALVARDGDEYVVLASAALAAAAEEQRPLALKILVDCSGSMQGDSIAAARRALLAVLDRLSATDLVSITRFGSTVADLTEGLETADADALPLMKALVREIQADLGGTEMAGALQHILSQTVPPDRTGDVILITDGEIHAVAQVVELAARSGHRLSAVAIGAAPNEALARSVTDKTGGSCEFVAAGDTAEPAIVRTFKRLRATPRTLQSLSWPVTPVWTGPLPTAVFPGDTLHLFAGFKTQPAGQLVMQVGERSRPTVSMPVSVSDQLSSGDLIPRIAAATRIASLPEAEARALAVRYQLVTAYTSMVVVASRAEGEKAQDLPQTIAVAQMLAAGWGGIAEASDVIPVYSNKMMLNGLPSLPAEGQISPCLDVPQFSRAQSRLDIPMPVRTQSDEPILAAIPVDECERLIGLLAEAHLSGDAMPSSLLDLETRYAVDPEVIDALEAAVNDGDGTEEEVIAAFLAMLIHKDASFNGSRHPELEAFLAAPVLGDRRYRDLRRFMAERFF